jgi:hypothetical protein
MDGERRGHEVGLPFLKRPFDGRPKTAIPFRVKGLSPLRGQGAEPLRGRRGTGPRRASRISLSFCADQC